MDTCVKCGMPMEEDSKCTCDPSLCFHCCNCPSDCSCGCSNMIDDAGDDEEEEEDLDDGEDDDEDM